MESSIAQFNYDTFFKESLAQIPIMIQFLVAQCKVTETRLEVSQSYLKESWKEQRTFFFFSFFNLQWNNFNGCDHDHYLQIS